MTLTFRAVVILGLVLAGCGGETESPQGQSTSEASLAATMLSRVLIQPDEELEGVRFDSSVSGPVPASALEAELAGPGEAWPLVGYIDAAQHVFRMLPPEDPQTFPAEDVRGVVNLGILFEDPSTASAFLDRSVPPEFVLQEAGPFGYGSLGEERRGLRTEATANRPVRTTLIWRRGSLFLQLNVFGDYELGQIMELASAVDARAEDLST
jgi:hypothetical protein